MGSLPFARRVSLAWVAAVTLACGPEGAVPGDGAAGSDESDAAPSRDGARDGHQEETEASGEVSGQGGPLTMLLEALAFAEEKVFDYDGDGVLDNAVADLGSPASELYAGILATGIGASIENGSRRMMCHFPWVDDLSGPTDVSTIFLAFEGEDLDEPADPTDDFSGTEPFYARPDDLDACGEPTSFLGNMRFDHGAVSIETDGGRFDIGGWGSLHGARAEGTVEPFGAAGQLLVGGYLLVAELGTSGEAGEPSRLEFLLAGGVPHGLPTIPGLSPDIDVDGDGLERFVLDLNGFIERCIDGDLTPIIGRDCWADERMADGVSVTMIWQTVGATFAGRAPDWPDEVEGVCEEPPDESLWDAR